LPKVCHIITKNDLRGIILVGHSYGGFVITGVADRLPGRIRHLVFLDSGLPDPGQSLFDLFAEGNVDPFSFPGLEAASAYVEKLRFDPLRIRKIPKTYILCTQSEFAVVTKVAKRKVTGQREGWTYIELPTSHVPMATMPGQFYRLVLTFANQ
jgi:pimeloyl-ACP methyl ester carboxylesterase